METLVSHAPEIRVAIERLELFFAGQQTRQAMLARQVLGTPRPDDATLAARLVEELGGDTRMDGSVGGGALPTVWRLIELADLGQSADDPAVARVLRWVLSLQGEPGAFGEGCSAARHSHRVCEHFMAGFFSPAPPAQRLAPITLPNGKVFRAEPAARFAVSCLALRAALRHRCGERPAVSQHVASLLRLHELWSDWSGYFAPDMIVSGMQALAHAGPAPREAAARVAAVVAANQADDGTWPNADLFHVLDGLLAVGSPEANEAVRRAAPGLTARQRADGSFGPVAHQERALIALRALTWAFRPAPAG